MSAGLLVGVGQPVAGWSAIRPDHVVYAVVAQGAVAFGCTRHNKLNHPCALLVDTVETLLDTVGDAPGARTILTASTSAGDVELLVPVVDGTLDPYKPYLPE